jgi:hypothetical protein
MKGLALSIVGDVKASIENIIWIDSSSIYFMIIRRIVSFLIVS